MMERNLELENTFRKYFHELDEEQQDEVVVRDLR